MLQKLKLAPSLAIFLSAAAIIWFSPGCQALTGTGAGTAPTTQSVATLQSLEETYRAALELIDAAEASGLITQAEATKFAPVLNAIQAALETATNDAAAGNVTAGQQAIDSITAALPSLTPLLTTIHARQTTPTTKAAK